MPEPGPSGGPTPPRATVLQLLGPSTGGIRRHVAALTTALRERGWQVSTAGPRGVLDGLSVELDAVVPVPGGLDPLAARRAVRALRGPLGGADLVHAHGLKAGWLATLPRHRPPVVVSVHNLVLDETAGWKAPLLRRLERALGRRADAVVALSPDIAGRMATARAPLTVIPPYGPAPAPRRSRDEVRAGLDLAPETALVVCVARLHPQKGLGMLLAAAGEVRRAGRDVCWLVVGEGPLEASLRAQVRADSLDGVVRLHGPSANAADELQAADVVVCTSVWESGPLAVAEAMTLGRPVASTPVGFVPELIEDGRTGRLVPLGDAGALAAAVAALLDDPTNAAALAEAGRARVAEKLGGDALVGAVEAVYREVLAR